MVIQHYIYNQFYKQINKTSVTQMSDMFQESISLGINDFAMFYDDERSQIFQNEYKSDNFKNQAKQTKNDPSIQLKMTGFDENLISDLYSLSSPNISDLNSQRGPKDPIQSYKANQHLNNQKKQQNFNQNNYHIRNSGREDKSQSSSFSEFQEVQKQYDINIFNQKRVQLGKNNNVPKHLMKQIIQKYFKVGEIFFQDEPKLLKQMKGFITKERKMYRQTKNWNNNLDSMNKIFGRNPKSQDPKLRSLLTRKMANYMIKNQIIPEIKMNNQINNLFDYLFSLKVQMHRCRNVQLIKRFKSH